MTWSYQSWFGGTANGSPSTNRQPARELEVAELWVYPIKSCRGFAVKRWPFALEGLMYDRQWLIVTDSRHRFVTAREHPRMLLIVPTLSLSSPVPTLTVSIPSTSSSPASSFTIPVDPPPSAPYEADFTIWGSPQTDGYDVGGGGLNDALSNYLGVKVCLILKGPATRTAGNGSAVEDCDLDLDYSVEDERTASGGKGKQAATKWADGYPFLLTTRESELAVQDIITDPSNSGTPGYDAAKWAMGGSTLFDPRRFRANVVSKGASDAWEEEGWLEVKVGSGEEGRWATLYPTARCGRCMVPNTDPDTAVRDAVVPFKLMKPTRAVGETTKAGPCFGVNAIPKQASGILAVGDRLIIQRRCPQGKDGIWQRPEDDRALAAKSRPPEPGF